MDRKTLCERLGNIEQLAGIRETRDSVTNQRLLEVWNGRLRFTVLADRGFDVGSLSLDGRNQVFQAKGGLAHKPAGDIFGGLFFTCGPDNVGPAEGKLPMHGSFRTTPATKVSAETFWQEDAYRLRLRGQVRHAALFGGNILLERTIETSYDSAALTVTDTITNEGFTPWPLMLLYHINAGYPLLDEGAEISLPPCETYLREGLVPVEDSAWNRMPAPAPGAPEKVYYHEGVQGEACLQVKNPVDGHSMTIRYHADALPVLTQWISPMAGDYALGLEPGTCHVESLSGEERRGTLQYLQPGRSKQVTITFEFA